MLQTLLRSQLDIQQGIVSLLAWDKSLFSGLVLPEGVDPELAVDTIVQLCGHTPLAHPDPEYLAWYIPRWSKRRLPIWSKLYATTKLTYDPIENYDRKSEYTDTTSRTLDRRGAGTDTRTQTGSNESEDKVSADNASTYQPDSLTTGSDSTEMSGASTQTLSDQEDTAFTHTERTHGNIGVTTTQQMIEEERRVVEFDIYAYIAADFKADFCLLVY